MFRVLHLNNYKGTFLTRDDANDYIFGVLEKAGGRQGYGDYEIIQEGVDY